MFMLESCLCSHHVYLQIHISSSNLNDTIKTMENSSSNLRHV